MLIDHWPLLGLRLRTGRLELRLPDEEELAELADVAAKGVHEPDRRPFLRPWSDLPPAERAREVVQRHWRRRGSWTPRDWSLDLTVFEDGHPVGIQQVGAQDFGILREVRTGSWLGLEHQGRGIGRSMRSAVLHLAFAGLGASEATTMSFADNPAPLRISRRLGYRPDGIARDIVDGEAVVTERLRLTRSDWELTDRPEVSVAGLGPCLALFGA
ncbi:GNAT family protein [Microbispora corallina]|uniref:Succinyl-CoA transferase n=1 Tax=Microbispora corallina TaxID=83302 RepID=A0ABQ4FRG7_9ACTN|nr:GNAT family protein [Microbispora corallina]GIH37405.1 putative succinyl-CoA transferase [Microbispora corallina]